VGRHAQWPECSTDNTADWRNFDALPGENKCLTLFTALDGVPAEATRARSEPVYPGCRAASSVYKLHARQTQIFGGFGG
jgi:hypothetical protein